MSDTLRHRGPDDSGTFVDEFTGVALGSRRLSVIDLSPGGHQPMSSSDGRYVVVYNGEIYNYLELRSDLERSGHSFRSSSDTEVLLASIQRNGLETTLRSCHGMFAFALWDRSDRLLHLVRDRFGEKPLYFGWSNGVFMFGSELKALRAHDSFSPEVDRDVLALYFRHNCVPSPHCIYRGISQVPPGTIVTLGERSAPGTALQPRPYWSLRDVVERGVAARATSGAALDVESTLDELDRVLGNAVSMRLHADVPFGAFLSGGIDSSLVVSLMQARGSSKARTFTIAFEDSAYDEAHDARRVAQHLGTEHLEMLVTANDALSMIPALPSMYDEPFADSSQIPTALLARLTRRHVTVALSGDGGDELFGGYNRYVWAERFWRRISAVPISVRRATASALGAVPAEWWDKLWVWADPVLPRTLRVRNPGTKLGKVARVMRAADAQEMYQILASHFDDPGRIVLGATEPPTLLTRRETWPHLEEPEDLMMYLDAVTYLPDDILTKVDRATMASSLESRLPFLDQDVAELAWRLPLDLKVKRGTGKWLLRRLLHRYVPPELVERPKTGFGIPLDAWLRGPLRSWAEDLLDPRSLERSGYLSVHLVRQMWDEALRGRSLRQYDLWDVLMFEAWLTSASR